MTGHERRDAVLSRRGAALLLFSFAYILVGVFSYVLTKPSDLAQEELQLPFWLAPSWLWGLLMASLGLFGVITAFSVGPHARDRWGWNGLVAWAVWWALCYLSGPLLYHSTFKGFTGATIYTAFAGAFYIISGFPDRAPGGRW